MAEVMPIAMGKAVVLISLMAENRGEAETPKAMHPIP